MTDNFEGKKKPADLEHLTAKIAAVRGKQTSNKPRNVKASMMGLAYRLMIEVMAGIGVGGFVGWWMDKWFGTAPVFMLVLLFLGMIAGVLGSVRTAADMRARATRENEE